MLNTTSSQEFFRFFAESLSKREYRECKCKSELIINKMEHLKQKQEVTQFIKRFRFGINSLFAGKVLQTCVPHVPHGVHSEQHGVRQKLKIKIRNIKNK